MRFLSALENDDIMSILDVLSMSMLYYNDVKFQHIVDDSEVIDSLAKSLVLLARHNNVIKNKKEIAVMEIDPSDLVKKVVKNGVTLGVVKGGRA